MFFFAKNIALLFVPEDLALVNEATFFLQVLSFSFGLIGIQMVLNGVFRGAGNTVIAMNLSILSLVSSIGLAYLFAFVLGFGYVGIWFAYPISNLINAIIAILVYLKGDWKKTSLVKDNSDKIDSGKNSGENNSKIYTAA